MTNSASSCSVRREAPAASEEHVFFSSEGVQATTDLGALSPACRVQVELLGVHDGDKGLLKVVDGNLAIDRATFDLVNNSTRLLEEEAARAGDHRLLQAVRKAMNAQSIYKNVVFEIGLGYQTRSPNKNEAVPGTHTASQVETKASHNYTTETAIQRSFNKNAQRSRMSPPPPPENRYLADEDLYSTIVSKAKGANGPNQDLYDSAPSSTLDISVLGDVEITVEELCAFFPLHVLHWEQIQARFVGAGWRATQIAALVYHYRGISGPDNGPKVSTVRATLQRRLQRVYDQAHLARDFTPKSWAVPTKIGNKIIREEVSDYGLLELSKGVMKYPSGDGARHLTQAVRTAKRLGLQDLMLSGLVGFIEEHAIGDDLSPMATGRPQPHHDEATLERLDAILRE